MTWLCRFIFHIPSRGPSLLSRVCLMGKDVYDREARSCGIYLVLITCQYLCAQDYMAGIAGRLEGIPAYLVQ